MTSDGTAYGRFRKSIDAGRVTGALSAAAELPRLTLGDALDLCRLLAETADARYPRAAARWLERLAAEAGATLAELQLAAGALARLREDPADELAQETLKRLAEYSP